MNKGVKIVVDPKKCTLSGECFKVCPLDAIYVKDGKAVIDCEKCDLDGICIPTCPNGAIGWVPAG
jgi:heterodisulfide reductase subunit A-like polyferredoxin